MNLFLFSKGLAGDGTAFPFVMDELRALYAGGEPVLVITAAGNNSAGAVRAARQLIAGAGHTPVLLHEQPEPITAIRASTAIYVSGGNVFRLAHALQTSGWLDPIRQRVRAGVPYAGGSAGAVIAGPTIATTNSMPLVLPPTLDALGLVDLHINAHYPSGADAHGLGETRQERILEVIDERALDVIALRDGSGLRVADTTLTVVGHTSARYFPRPGGAPHDIAPGLTAACGLVPRSWF